MKDRIGVGIVGTGFARRVQIPAFLSCEHAAIVSVASGNADNARSTASESGAEHFTSDWRETISHPDVDLVCITTPPNLHCQMVLFAIEQGKHILCEKPMAMNVAEAEEMTAAAEGKSALALIDHELRFQPGRQKAFQMLREGAIGEVRHAKYIFQAPHRGDPGIPWNWWSDIHSGGGAIGAIGSHIIDSFQWFLGADVSSVSCQLQTHIKQRLDGVGTMREVTSDDEANMLLRFADGDITSDATGLVSISMTEYPKYKNRLEFYGAKGTIRIDYRGDIFIAAADDDNFREIDVRLGDSVESVPDTGFSRAFTEFARQIVAAIRNDSTQVNNAATFADGVRVQRVLDAARESDRSGCFVMV